MLSELLLSLLLSFSEVDESTSELASDPIVLSRPSVEPEWFVEKTTESTGPVLVAPVALSVERGNGFSLFEKRSEERRAPASLTKIMTALVVLEEGPELDTVVSVSAEAAATSGATMLLEEGESFTVRDLLHGMMTVSGNDAAVQLAISTSGSVSAFVEEMNAHAKRLGLQDTQYQNPTGLDQEGHYSTARDVARVFDAALRTAEFEEAIQHASYTATNQSDDSVRSVTSTNDLVKESYPLAVGGKTGFTDDAGYCMVMVSSDDAPNHEIVTVVLGSDSLESRVQDTKTLIDWSYRSYAWPSSSGDSSLSF